MTATRVKHGKPENLDQHYERLEAGLTVRSNRDYERLVTANGNSAERVHRWFHLKEAFSKDLLPRVLKDTGLEGCINVLDPFSGCGTTAVAAGNSLQDGSLEGVSFRGYECNPFLQLVSQCKLRALQVPSMTFLPLAKKVAAQVARGRIDVPARPDLSTFHDPRYFEDEAIDRLLGLRQAIQQASREGARPDDTALALLCLGTAVEPASALRRDGRALRYVPDKRRADPIDYFLRRAEDIDDDMTRQRIPVKGKVLLGDGRTCRPQSPPDHSVDLAVFSPPYPNNIDYTEVYKLEAWLLDLIRDDREFVAQRLKTLHSHPSRKRPVRRDDAGEDQWLDSFLDPIVRAIPDDRYSRGRREMVKGYAGDMLTTLRTIYRATRPDGHLVYVVGASLHGSGTSAFVLASDLLLARLAEYVGFDVEAIEVARQLRRRGSSTKFLRESVVFARRPASRR